MAEVKNLNSLKRGRSKNLLLRVETDLLKNYLHDTDDINGPTKRRMSMIALNHSQDCKLKLEPQTSFKTQYKNNNINLIQNRTRSLSCVSKM